MKESSRQDMLALTPDRYLAAGWQNGAGKPLAALSGEFATAAATQLLQGGLAPQELAFLQAALEQLLPMQKGAPHDRAQAALADALQTTARMIRQANNPALSEWAQACAVHVQTESDLAAFLDHLRSVRQLYGLLASMQPEEADPGD